MTPTDLAPRPKPSQDFALVLGGGGAKGLAHIVVIEALDELGIRPREVAGTSIGAIIGACYCAGMSGAEMRDYALGVLRMKPDVLRALFAARVGRFSDMLRGGLTNPVLVDAEKLLAAFLPPVVPETFESLVTPLTVVATDYYARVDVGFTDGPLVPAVAASMAIPGAIRPVRHRGHVLIDGGTINPVPVDRVTAAVTLAVDVLSESGTERQIDDVIPDPWDAMFGSVTLMMQVLSAIRLAEHRPTIHLRPPVDAFRVLDFLRAGEIMEACEPVKDEVKRRVTLALEAIPAELAIREGL
ncbi:MAG: patatin-like phospholipase family protein [Phreatobacter sp.]|uniref:patatin-like phospholipase family protein n=1 Tax=Phreatobacter sp. TaxID=1966341 RepID=UPI00273425FD|nr:patatin-like phospholipase family protein [Phreatobacter sp.]MDP2803863.1 patatin-like phospholipase family protein [Phreatobacter sp.]